MPKNTTPNYTASELAFFGSKPVDVTYFNGREETVIVRAVPIRELRKLLELFDDETGRISLYTGRPVEWAETLSGPSLAKLLEVGDVGNFPRFQALAPARERLAAMFPPEPETPGGLGSPSSPKSPLEATA